MFSSGSATVNDCAWHNDGGVRRARRCEGGKRRNVCENVSENPCLHHNGSFLQWCASGTWITCGCEHPPLATCSICQSRTKTCDLLHISWPASFSLIIPCCRFFAGTKMKMHSRITAIEILTALKTRSLPVTPKLGFEFTVVGNWTETVCRGNWESFVRFSLSKKWQQNYAAMLILPIWQCITPKYRLVSLVHWINWKLQAVTN